MKKSIAIIMLSCLTFIICACKDNLDKNANISTEPSDDSIASGYTNNSVPLEGGERLLLTIESINEYEKLMSSTKMPDDFVIYEKIKPLGEFKSLVFLSDSTLNDFSSYMYTLVDETGYELALYINSNISNDTFASNDSIISLKTNDMRLTAEKINGIYELDNIIYRYVSGELLSITWVDQNVCFTLCGSSMLSNYPSDNSTFVGKLLNSDEALRAFSTIFEVTSK